MRARAVGLCVLIVLVVGCGDSGGPANPSELEGVSIINETLFPAADTICHVRGTVVNDRTDVTVDVTMRWRAIDAGATEIGTTKIRVQNVRPGTRQDFESTGFASNDRGLMSCGDIIRFERFETSIATH
jgi:hypothetical protein